MSLALTRLALGQIQAAVLQKLAMMMEAAKVTSFRQNRQRSNSAHSWKCF